MKKLLVLIIILSSLIISGCTKNENFTIEYEKFTDEQMEIFESTVEFKEVPEEFASSSFVYLSKKKTRNILSVQHANTEGERNWAIAAREGGEIPEDIRQKMRKDKETARKETNGDKR